MNWEAFGNNIRSRRKEKRWDQGELARRIGKQQYQISQYENGKPPSGNVLAVIAEQLEMRFLDFENSSFAPVADGQFRGEAAAAQLALPFEEGTELWIALEPRGDPVARITCKKEGTLLLVTASVENANKQRA